MSRPRKLNRYYTENGYMVGVTSSGYKFKFDIEDYEVIKPYTWAISNGYVKSTVDGKSIIMHRIILDAPKGKMVDHINGDGKDNRKQNLRLCSNAQNIRNAKLYATNTSGHRGVRYVKEKRKWRAEIGYNGKMINLGYGQSIEDAIKLRKSAEQKYFGEFAPRR